MKLSLKLNAKYHHNNARIIKNVRTLTDNMMDLNVIVEKNVIFSQDKRARFIILCEIGNGSNEPVKWAILTFSVPSPIYLMWKVRSVCFGRQVDKLMRRNTYTAEHTHRHIQNSVQVMRGPWCRWFMHTHGHIEQKIPHKPSTISHFVLE